MSRYEKLIKNPILREEEILALWKEQGTFQKSLAATVDGPRYVFFEGPPTANGKPHFGHLMPRVYKDLFPRYKTMQGFYVARKGGWDTHGLPVELEVEKEIGLNSKPEIESYGVEKFVEQCKESVWKYKGEWERMIERMGFWIDLENAYVTYTDDYIETVWWELAQMFDRGLLYRGHKVLP
jgi:isoleucyl-tRNA synthetase